MLIFLLSLCQACLEINYTTDAVWPESCSAGYQSPIDISKSDKVSHYIFSSYPIQSNLTASNCDSYYSISCKAGKIYSKDLNGNTIVSLLSQILFHAPSEHMISGQLFDLEVQLVHNVLTQSNYQTVVLSFLFNSSLTETGFFNQFIENDSLDELITSLDLSPLVQTNFPLSSYFLYPGSMTVPPCQTSVLWYVQSTPLGISSENLAVFTAKWQDNSTFAEGNGNNRPDQPILDRVIQVNR